MQIKTAHAWLNATRNDFDFIAEIYCASISNNFRRNFRKFFFFIKQMVQQTHFIPIVNQICSLLLASKKSNLHHVIKAPVQTWLLQNTEALVQRCFIKKILKFCKIHWETSVSGPVSIKLQGYSLQFYQRQVSGTGAFQLILQKF